MLLKRIRKGALAAIAVTATLAVGACSDDFDGVQLNGKIFDAVGLNTGSVKTGDPKLAARQPLVIPPGLDSLPPPGSGKAEQPTLADVQDPDAKAKLSREDLERQQQDYCSKNYAPAVQRGDDSADLIAGPLGPCRGSIFNVVKKWTGKGDTDDDSEAQ